MKKISLQNILIVAVLLLCTFVSAISGYSYAANHSYQGYMKAYQRGVYLNGTVQLALTKSFNNVTWRSDNSNIAKVNTKGVVTGLKYNSTTFVRAYSNGTQIGACKIVVKGPAYQGYMSAYQRSVSVGSHSKLNLTQTFTNVTWSVDHPNIVRVNNDGWFEALKPNKDTYIRAYSNGKQVGACRIFTKNPPYQGAMTAYQRNLIIKDNNSSGTVQLSVNKNYANKSLTWHVDCPDYIATVNNNGLVTGYEPGYSIMVSAKYGNTIIGKCKVVITTTRKLVEYDDFLVVDNSLLIQQAAHSNNFDQDRDDDVLGDKCLGFAFTYAGAINSGGNISKVSGDPSDSEPLMVNWDDSVHKNNFECNYNQQLVLEIYHQLADCKKACVIQVVGSRNDDGTPRTRHYVTAIGYRKGKTTETIKDTDILIIDTWDSELKTLVPESAKQGRSLFNHKKQGGEFAYLVYACK